MGGVGKTGPVHPQRKPPNLSFTEKVGQLEGRLLNKTTSKKTVSKIKKTFKRLNNIKMDNSTSLQLEKVKKKGLFSKPKYNIVLKGDSFGEDGLSVKISKSQYKAMNQLIKNFQDKVDNLADKSTEAINKILLSKKGDPDNITPQKLDEYIQMVKDTDELLKEISQLPLDSNSLYAVDNLKEKKDYLLKLTEHANNKKIDNFSETLEKFKQSLTEKTKDQTSFENLSEKYTNLFQSIDTITPKELFDFIKKANQFKQSANSYQKSQLDAKIKTCENKLEEKLKEEKKLLNEINLEIEKLKS